ncbi:MAG TPA: glycosyltransferase [Pyrinomonadaceae bacterium]|nr:glycosyltransferase [Pyrinomonadaceae bacterium]
MSNEQKKPEPADGDSPEDLQQKLRMLETELEARAQTIEALTAELTARGFQMSAILNSRAWRWLSRYSRLRRRYLAPAYESLQSLYGNEPMAPSVPGDNSNPPSRRSHGEQVLAASEIRTLDDLPESRDSLVAPEPKQLFIPPPTSTLPSQRFDVVCFSIFNWDFRYQRPQQIMSQFSAHGHRVFYLRLDRVLPLQDSPRFSVSSLKENVYQVTLAAMRAPWINHEDIKGKNAQAFLASLEDLRRAYQINEAIAYVMTPSWASAALEAKNRWGWRLIYDCMDEWNGFPGMVPDVTEAEQRLARQCDLVVVTSQHLYDKWCGLNRPMILARNAVDYDFYAKGCRPNPLLASVEHPVVGYYGAIADWFDVELVTYVARKRPNYTFVLLGEIVNVDVSKLERLPNVRVLGQQPYETMPQYLYHFDACLIPFRMNRTTEATDPVKVYEYLSGGKPVVSVALPELESFRDLLYIARDRDDFLVQLDKALTENDPLAIERRRSFAAQNTWQKRYETIIRKLENQQEIELLSSELAGKQRDLEAKQDRIESLSPEAAKAERSLKILSEQLAAKDHQLKLILNSRSWRLVMRYARWKNRYLIPPYRSLRTLLKKPLAQRKIRTTEKSRRKPQMLFPSPEQVGLLASVSSNTSPAALPKPDVVCFSIVDWDFRTQRPQQLMSQFAAAGHRVFYVSQNFHPGQAYRFEERRQNIYEVSLRGLERNVYTDVLDDEARDALFNSLDALRRDVLLGATVAFVQLPFWWPLVNEARNQFAWPVVYDCMDHHRGFSTNKQSKPDQEHDLLASADLVVTSSDFLGEQACQHSSNVLMVRNACDYEHFANVGQANGVRRVVGYYGAIADWFDSDLVADLAERRPDWNFLLVGSTFSGDIGRLARLPNVVLPGEKPYSEIPGWLSRFDVAIIPFKRGPLTDATNPVKAYEILAGGKPLVSVPIPEMTAFASLVRLASTAEEFEKEITAALDENGPELVAKRRAFASEHTWQKRYEILAPAVRNVFPKASLIIVTFNNLELSRLCLESLYARTEWPSFEVIVVDNGSADGTAEYLKEAENIFPNLRVVLNQTNLGFAAANNIGLKLATGDYLVLLNNDTVVTRGWLSALIRHLRRDPKIGMIGPVTNAIANEAKVEVDYTTVEDMPVWAADYVRKHDAQVLPISMLAMFCVAMRREVFEEVGPLDERFGVGMFEDDDYARRLRGAGYELRLARDSFVHHWQRASFRLIADEEYRRIYQENQNKYEIKWGKRRGTRNNLHSGQLKEVLAKVEKSKGVVIFLPSIGWNIHLFQRPHHLAREFARLGYVSIFDSSNSNDEVNGFKEIESNLFLFRGPEDVLHEIPDSVLWTFPYNFDRKDFYPRTSRTIYDWVDDLEVFPYDRSFLERNHRRGLREASAVVSVALSLHERALATRTDAIHLPNGVEYQRFAAEAETPDDSDIEALLGEGKPIAGYYGALAEWFDYKLLDEVACLRPDWNFLLIGQSLDQSLSQQQVLQHPNVKWIGPRPYESLPAYLRVFDVATIPFLINNITEATSPLKLYEYFAAGKAVITTAMPECESFSDVRIVRSAGEFSQALDRARKQGRDEEYRTRVRAIARENSWTVRMQTVERILRQTAQPNQKATQSLPPVATAPEAQPRAPQPQQQRLVGAAAELARRFRHFDTVGNRRFFDALCNHLSSLASDSCLPMYFEFAITCNERGRRVATLLKKYTKLRGKRYLDVGCAYAGFLVAFAQQGAEVVGIDTDEVVLTLAQPNLLDNKLKAPLLKKDATRFEELEGFRNSFDIITCNDVIEHVDDPQSLLCNIANLMRDDGVAYFEIPNRFHPRHVLQDGHYQLFGITLLDYPQAHEYYSLHAPGVPYGVRHYLELQQYTQMFEEAGMTLTVMEESFGALDMKMVHDDIAELRASAQTRLDTVPQTVRHRVEERLSQYLNELENLSLSTPDQQADFRLRYGLGFWQLLARKAPEPTKSVMAGGHLGIVNRNQHRPRSSSIDWKESPAASNPEVQSSVKRRACFKGMPAHPGRCNICGNDTLFFYNDPASYRESLVCGECLTTSRYRSIARGILRAIQELTGIDAESVAELDPLAGKALRIYDTQVPFYFEACAYPVPDLLSSCKWIELQTSQYHPQQACGLRLGGNITNQNLEALTYSDSSFDIVITSDVMEHVRLHNRAHQEIRRVLKPGGIYLFTVPHFRDRHQTFFRVAVADPEDPAKDVFITEKEYHGDANSEDGRALSYRSYGTDIDETLRALGFDVDYCKTDFPELGIMNTELFFCRLRR